MKRVIVVGSAGQDGTILSEELSKSCAVVGITLEGVTAHGVDSSTLPSSLDIGDASAVRHFIEQFQPNELYYLAARHHSSEEQPDDGTELRESVRVNLFALVNVLEAVRLHAPRCRVFYAGSSHMFGEPATSPQNELTPYAPRNPYAIAKVAGAHTCALYRTRHGLHASVGILYNHESPLRGERFVSQRIARGACAASRNPNFRLKLGSLSAVVDWGHAIDFVKAMIRITAHPEPGDYIVATGVPHTVRDFVEVAFRVVGLDWRNHVEGGDTAVQTPSFTPLIGDATKLRTSTGWRPDISFERMVELMVNAARKSKA